MFKRKAQYDLFAYRRDAVSDYGPVRVTSYYHIQAFLADAPVEHIRYAWPIQDVRLSAFVM